MRSGISPVIAATLLIAIAVIGSTTVWFWVSPQVSEPAIAETANKAYVVTKVYPNSTRSGCSSLDIKNTGGAPISDILLEVRDYVTGRPVGANGTDSNVTAHINISAELLPGSTMNYNLSSIGNASNITSVPGGAYVLRASRYSDSVTGLADQMFTCADVQSIRGGILSIYLQNASNEKFSNGVVCSASLYVAENNRTKFFISVPNMTDGTDCATPATGYNYYALSPMRIWTKDAETAYRVNSVILDNTYFRMTDTAAHTLYADNMSQFNVSDGKITITPTLSPASSLFDVKVIYTLPPDDVNYVKITFWAKNKDSSTRTVYFSWLGDQDPPSGTWYNETYGNCGICTGNSCTGGLNARKWVAFARCGGNDGYGILMTPEDTISLSIYSEPNLITNTVAVNPGQEYEFSFYLMSDLQGPVGEEWKPVEDLYNELFGT
jgi:FlaG/FlaF family flagellin (archaellin)